MFLLCLFRFGKKPKVDADSVESEDEEEVEEEPNVNESIKILNSKGSGFEKFDIEETGEIDREDDAQSDDEDGEKSDSVDNFSKHFNAPFTSKDIELLSKSEKTSTSFTWPAMGSFVECKTENEKFDLLKLEKPLKSIDQLQLKPMLRENMGKTMLDVSEDGTNRLTAFQTELLSLMSNYKDIYFPERSEQNGEQIRVAYTTHALNHILKTRSRILSHNSKINQNQGQKSEYRDQGLTRAKVLIIAPFRQSAYQTVNCMINLLFGDVKDTGSRKINIMNYKRFKTEFGPADDEPPMSAKKPDDYKKLFAGNIDDSFRVGLSLTKKSLKLYTDFYSSDIIIASPLGLRLTIGAEGEEEHDFDFLSSIEMVIFDQADVFLMQNWEHVFHIMNHLHLRPKKDHGVDYSRVKLWILELWSRYYCQLLLFSSTSHSMISAFFNKFSANFSGKIISRNEIPSNRAAINHIYIQCPQIFHRYSCDNFANSSDIRFDFFVNQILPKFKEKLMVRTMIYVPSYFDFVRLRNYFRREDIGINQICEYTKEGKVAQARHMFFYGGRHFLLYTERYHFFHRRTIKGIRHLIFYEPPTYSHFYSELVNSMHLSNQGKKLTTDYSSMSVTVLFSKYDAHSLVSLLGTKKATSLLQSSTDVHMFLTENALS